MKKVLSAFVAFVVMIGTTPAFAQINQSLSKQTIGASGLLVGSSSLSVSIVANGSPVTNKLSFNSSKANGEKTVGVGGVVAPQIVKLSFDSNEAGFNAIIISTDNRTLKNGLQYTGNGTGSGLVGESDSKTAAPLHWVVFPTQTEAANYNFVAQVGGVDDGKIKNTNQLFVADRQQDASTDVPKPAAFNTAPVLGFATVVGGISGKDAFLASVPVNKDGVAPVSGEEGKNRLVTDGNAYMRLAVDFKGQAAQAYRTETLTVDLVTLS